MMKLMSADEYKKLTDSDKLEIERLLFETVKEETEKVFPYLKVEKINFGNYWEKLDDEVNRWGDFPGFVLSNGETYVRLPRFDFFDGNKINIMDENYGNFIYTLQENVFDFFKLPNSVFGVKLAWGEDDYDF